MAWTTSYHHLIPASVHAIALSHQGTKAHKGDDSVELKALSNIRTLQATGLVARAEASGPCLYVLRQLYRPE